MHSFKRIQQARQALREEHTPGGAIPSDASIEHEIQAKGKTAARVTPADIEAAIVSEWYFRAIDGADHVHQGSMPLEAIPCELGLLTFCVLVLRNGFTVTGESACASPENFDAEIGRKVARANAAQKIWQLEGYLLKQRLHEAANPAAGPISAYAPHQQRVIDEKAQNDERLLKLNGFFGTAIFTGLDEEERERLAAQARVMAQLSTILGDRIAAF